MYLSFHIFIYNLDGQSGHYHTIFFLYKLIKHFQFLFFYNVYKIMSIHLHLWKRFFFKMSKATRYECFYIWKLQGPTKGSTCYWSRWGACRPAGSVPPCWERGGMNYSGGARCHVDRVVRGHAMTCRPGGATLSNGF